MFKCIERKKKQKQAIARARARKAAKKKLAVDTSKVYDWSTNNTDVNHRD